MANSISTLDESNQSPDRPPAPFLLDGDKVIYRPTGCSMRLPAQQIMLLKVLHNQYPRFVSYTHLVEALSTTQHRLSDNAVRVLIARVRRSAVLCFKIGVADLIASRYQYGYSLAAPLDIADNLLWNATIKARLKQFIRSHPDKNEAAAIYQILFSNS
jgi:DNA-binding winged helix-turn-helix (wHTH) protein